MKNSSQLINYWDVVYNRPSISTGILYLFSMAASGLLPSMLDPDLFWFGFLVSALFSVHLCLWCISYMRYTEKARMFKKAEKLGLLAIFREFILGTVVGTVKCGSLGREICGDKFVVSAVKALEGLRGIFRVDMAGAYDIIKSYIFYLSVLDKYCDTSITSSKLI